MKTHEFNYCDNIFGGSTFYKGRGGFEVLAAINAGTGHALWSSRPREVVEAQ